ncbi:hypothetical protein VCHENC02_5951B, partial [Vibrio harveyi]
LANGLSEKKVVNSTSCSQPKYCLRMRCV